MAPIVLLTDYGSAGPYPAALRGVILSLAPFARIVDLSHDAPPFSVTAGMWLLQSVHSYFPRGTIFAAVVDPGVGTQRRALGVRAGGRTYLGPDNGILSFLKQDGVVDGIVELTNRRYVLSDVSRTFHGRDVFAPVAAHLSRGVPLRRMGPALPDFLGDGLPRAARSRGGLRGEVIYADPFGNLVTSVREEDLAPLRRGGLEPVVWARGRRIGRVLRTYAEAPRGEILALIGSSGRLEIAVREGNAASALRARIGDAVQVRLKK